MVFCLTYQDVQHWEMTSSVRCEVRSGTVSRSQTETERPVTTGNTSLALPKFTQKQQNELGYSPDKNKIFYCTHNSVCCWVSITVHGMHNTCDRALLRPLLIHAGHSESNRSKQHLLPVHTLTESSKKKKKILQLFGQSARFRNLGSFFLQFDFCCWHCAHVHSLTVPQLSEIVGWEHSLQDKTHIAVRRGKREGK